ncbi:MAG: hypothetical protein PVJ57_22785, partial [Phycisphaerae bacterium]
MYKARKTMSIVTLFIAVTLSASAAAQITSNAGDGVLNAPYRGTITSLRELCADIPYGEVKTHCEPLFVDTNYITSSTYSVWVLQETADDQSWDRSVIRLFEGVDGSGAELDLTGTSQANPITRSVSADDFVRMSVKAIGTRTTEPLKFRLRFSYSINGTPTTATRTFVVAPITGSFSVLPGESEAFHLGTPILDVTAGAAHLMVPVGRTAEMIGATFEDKDNRLGPSVMQTADVLLPGAAESVFIQNSLQFKLGGTYGKTAWGAPWPGHLIGYYSSGDTWGPDATHYDSDAPTGQDGVRCYDRIRPRDLANAHPATQQLTYDGSDLVTQIHDGASPHNVITLQRSVGVVTRITTSDGRGWDIGSDQVDGWITSVEPDSGKGARFFVHNAAGRVTQVKDANDQVMYEYVYANDPTGLPTKLTTERRYIQADGELRDAVVHETIGDYHLRRKEFTGSGEYRQYDFFYDEADSLRHRLACVRTYRDPNGADPPHYDTIYTHDINKPAGAMVITQITLPDLSTIAYEYDHHLEAGTVHFGFRSKTTHTGAGGSLVTYDVDHDFLYVNALEETRLYHRPRIVAERDGLGHEVGYQYEEGGVDSDLDGRSDGLTGEKSNDLLRRFGPTIAEGCSGTRVPEARYYYYNYYDPEPVRRVLKRVEVDYDDGLCRNTEYEYDDLLRRTAVVVDRGGKDIRTEYQYVDDAPTQDRIVIDPDDYWTKTQFDADGRVSNVRRYLDPGGATGNYYQTAYQYDVNGRLEYEIIDNKDQAGVALSPATITTQYTHDRLGRLTMREVDPSGIGQESHTDYNWLNDVTQTYDTSGRGMQREYDGRGLVKYETPVTAPETPVGALTTEFTYDAMGRLRFTDLPTGAQDEIMYDDFGRTWKQIRHPGPDGGSTITNEFEYDAASHVERGHAYEDDGRTIRHLSDVTHEYDEGGFRYESRQRLTAGDDTASDPLTQWKFDWAGNVIEERAKGESGRGDDDRVITTLYDAANRVESTLDSEDGETIYDRDDRGNVEQLQVKLTDRAYAVTDTMYDALSRATRVTDPPDATGLRHYRERFYDSRGNLRRETAKAYGGDAVQTAISEYDNAGRLDYQAMLDDADGTALAGRDVDRVVDYEYDQDGRLRFRTTYNNGTTSPLTTETTYDSLGRVDVVTDPSGSTTSNGYAANGRLNQRTVDDGYGPRVFTFGYDGHDRVTSRTAVGDGRTPALVTSYELDGLGRAVRITDPKGVITRTDYDLTGQRVAVVENEGGGVLERTTNYDYDRLNQLVTQTAVNKSSSGTPLDDQVTQHRYDTLGRLECTVYPDSLADPEDPDCVDCLRMAYDLGGRQIFRHDQRAVETTYVHDDRGLLISRTTGRDVDTFGYDALGRMTSASRGDSQIERDYTDLGDLDYETQTLGGRAARTVDYTSDQAGNCTQLQYPNGAALTYTATALNQVDTITLGVNPLVEYGYKGDGHLLDFRRTTTDEPSGTTVYDTGFDYDIHRRTTVIENYLEVGGLPDLIASYGFTHDANGNPLTQTAGGWPDFAPDDRVFAVDDLDRLTGTTYDELGSTESTTFDLLGNREMHTDRAGTTTPYGPVNAANEYPAIDGYALAYDAAGNLIVDEEGREYDYDEFDRLTEVRDVEEAVLVRYTYDALGRRVLSEFSPNDPPNAYTIRYVYDGRRIIEERDAADALTCYHVNGAQFIDERVATYRVEEERSAGPGAFPAGAGGRLGVFTYYLESGNHSVVAVGDAAGSVVERLDYGSGGDFGGSGPVYLIADSNCDGLVSNFDITPFLLAMEGREGWEALYDCDYLCANDLTGDGLVNNFDLSPFISCLADGGCGTCTPVGSGSAPPPTGTFALHGRPVDVLADGKVLVYVRARY